MTEGSAGRKRANGEGTIYARKDGRFEGAAYVLMTDGTVRRQRVYGRTRREAFDKLAKIQQHSREGIPMPSESWTVDRYLAYWLEHVVRPSSKPKTHEGYEGIVRVHLAPTLGRKRIKSLQAADVRRLLLRAANRCRCCEEGIDSARPEKQRKCCAVGRCCGKFPGTRRLQQIHAVLRNALQSACKEEIIMRNVARLVSVPAPNYRVHRGVNVEQARRLIAEAEGDRFHALYVMTLYLGMRRAELLGLAWTDVDLDAGHLEITQTLQRVDGALRLVPTKTRSSERTVPLVGQCGEALRAHRAQQAWDATQTDGWTDSGLVFTSTTGTPLEPDNLRRSWYPLRERVGLGGVRFHDLRHSAVSLLLGLGVPPHIVRDIVGHAHIGVTMEIYAHASLAEKRAALAKLDERLR
ncbi:site-specific integrase [Pseudonocardia petroleophila]|uniref:Site-specific integrase n=1 Tax=Pseudonocardia petroleophila TaxID=37331 RepID=A0A7G7MKX8_9PSEU|nr:site-specific integrase [Pseudonocardia petroleophila]QNG53439.1 site-specific integrase [Pseudonocardia petroleophila]